LVSACLRAGEVLDGGNKYKCSKEQKLVRAVKRMTIHAAPNVLVVQLKRFEFSMSGHKISKKVCALGADLGCAG
jgi:ubiquitin carboxyl-terminal hydrolase 36/42